MFLASEANSAIVVRRGPTRVVATLGWNRADGTFKMGQWLKGRINIDRCDLSPDGLHFLYSATKYDPACGYNVDYTVLSRAPYLKALHYWAPEHYLWVGAFLSHKEFWIYRFPASLPEVFSLPSLARLPEALLVDVGKWGSHIVTDFRCKRDGWILGEGTFQHRQLWTKSWGDWTLVYSTYNWARKQSNYTLKQGKNEVVSNVTWGWADFDAPRSRLCFTRDGQLWALDLKDNAREEMIHDFNSLQFEPLVAPY